MNNSLLNAGAAPILVLGAGLAGLAAGSVLGEACMVLESGSRPGGLVRTESRNGFWFDRVLHLLYFSDPETERRVRDLLGDDLMPCAPTAWVESRSGTTRFPLQMHLGELDPEAAVRCLRDLAEVCFASTPKRMSSFEDMLINTFGRALCEEFFFPYNRKVWKRPLEGLASSGFQWNVTHPDFVEVLRGALDRKRVFDPYNSAGWYPRPPAHAPARGMEVLSRALAARVADLRLGHEVTGIDLDKRLVSARAGGSEVALRYEHGCVATLPLPILISLCERAPAHVRRACANLKRNRVLSIALAVRGSRPAGRGHWRYYSDESICFTRLVHMHELDPDSAPQNGWGMLVEVTEPAERPMEADSVIVNRVIHDVRAVDAIPAGCEIVDVFVMVNDPAYVVFDMESRQIVEEAIHFLTANDIWPVGRYGRWEYSSMSQVLRDAFALAERVRPRPASTGCEDRT